jgi:hypothetical protein
MEFNEDHRRLNMWRKMAAKFVKDWGDIWNTNIPKNIPGKLYASDKSDSPILSNGGQDSRDSPQFIQKSVKLLNSIWNKRVCLGLTKPARLHKSPTQLMGDCFIFI